MPRITRVPKEYRPRAVLLGIVLMLTAIPTVQISLLLGDSWQGIMPTITDELTFARLHSIGDGHLTNGNAYFLEHSDGPPLVLFGGAWLNAIPMWLGIPFNTALMLNFIMWSVLFAVCGYWLFKELSVSSWVAVGGTLFLYLESYSHVWRPVNLQPVFPFYFLFYIALARFIREQNRANIIFLALTTGATFYLFAFLWQTAVVTLGLLFLYAFSRRDWPFLKATLTASIAGGIIGLPVPLYLLWLSHSSPYFWESLGRLGLVSTHLPMAEIIYSGEWIGIALGTLYVLNGRVKSLRDDARFISARFFFVVSGLGLWIMQGSNLITGRLFETGEHVRRLILPWLVIVTVSMGMYVWRHRADMSNAMRIFSVAVGAALLSANAYFLHQYFTPFLFNDRESWELKQSYARPFAWLQEREKDPVVVWSDPHDHLATNLPIFTRHFTLYAYWGMLELVSSEEIRERYLISQYFNNPTFEDLTSESEMALYLGRKDFPHQAKTIERGIKICRIVYFWDKYKDCGEPPTPRQLLGEKFFIDLEQKFRNDIRPHIKEYLKKYHVSYILKDKVLNPKYHPEKLGAVRVYADERYEIYSLRAL